MPHRDVKAIQVGLDPSPLGHRAPVDLAVAGDVGRTADTGTAVIWAARHITYGPHRRPFCSFSWPSIANASPNAFPERNTKLL